MLGYLFARLWKNPVSRFGTIAALLLISFGVIFSARQTLYKSFSRTFSSTDWGDVVRHSARPFAFEENENKARDLTEDAWREIYALARKKIGGHEEKAEPLTGSLTRKPYAAFLHKEAETEIFTFFNALKADCGNLRTSLLISDHAPALGELATSATPAARLAAQLRITMRDLLKIHALRVEAALQKKPDFIPALEISEEIFRATCGVREIAVMTARAIDYREYALQKQIYDSDSGRLYERNPELFQLKSSEAYQRDPGYRELLIRYFEATRYRTPYEPAHLKNMQNAYAALRSPKTVPPLIAALLAEARNSNAAIAKKCHFELFALDFPGITERSDYVYALAETAVRGEEFARANNIIANALKSNLIKDETTLKDLERLRFHIELMRHESENLSRF